MIKVLFLAFLFILCSCSSPRFAKDGVFVEDVDEYFNPKQDINVWVYANFHPYIGLDRGVRLGSFYPKDKEVLKKIGFKSRNAKVLFSAVPESNPSYYLIAIQHLKSKINLQGFERIEADSSYYFQKDFKLDQLDIRQVYIPYSRGKALSLVYYISSEKHYACPYCKLDYLARVNAKELQYKKVSVVSWQIFNCVQSQMRSVEIVLNKALIKKHKRTYLKIYADYESSRGIQYFQVLNPSSKVELQLKLCPEPYIIELLDDKLILLQKDTLVVK